MNRDSRRGPIFFARVLTMAAFCSVRGQTPVPGSLLEGVFFVCEGDVNLDGLHGPGDLALLAAHLSGEQVLAGQALANADVNLDGIVDMGDSVRLLQDNTGEFPLSPCGEFSPLQLACPDLLPEKESAGPMERVGLGLLPAELREPTVAVVTEESGELGLLTTVERMEDGSATLFTPFYPGVSIAGGAVNVRVTDGIRACPGFEFTIEALPPAPGEFSSVVDTLQDLVQAIAGDLELTTEDLLSGDPELPSHALPLVAAQALLDDPANPNSLRAMSQATAPFLEDDPDNTLLDAILARMQLRGTLEEELEDGQGPSRTSPSGLSHPCEPSVIGDSAARLDSCMKQSREAEKKLKSSEEGPIARKVREDILIAKDALTTATGTGVEAWALETAAKKFVKNTKIYQIIDLGLKIRKLALQAEASLLPSVLTTLEFEVSPEVMEEDLEEGTWGNSELVAMSKGWKFDVRRFLAQEAFKKLPTANGPVVLGRRMIGGAVRGREFTHKEMEKAVTDALLEHAIPFEGQGVFQIEPMAFGPVDIDEENWSRVEIKNPAVAKLDHNRFEPAQPGSAEIIVRVRTDGDRFGTAGSLTAVKPVQVKRIVMRIEPKELILGPGEPWELTLTVENSAFPKKVKVEARAGDATSEPGKGDTHVITYRAPENEDQFPDQILATHTATTGARKSGDPRTAKATIKARAEVIVLPEKNCVDPGQSTDIIHFVEGIEDQSVTWDLARVSGEGGTGTIGSEGLFTAPNSPGHIQITATSVADTTAKGAAVVKVGGCDCWWSITVDGRPVFSLPPDKTSFFVQGGQLIVAGFDDFDGGIFEIFPASPGGVAVAPGTYDFAVNGSVGLSPPDFLFFSEEEPVKGDLIEFTPTRMEAHISGLVTIATTNDDIEEPVVTRKARIDARFQVFADPQFPPASCFVVLQ